MKSFIKSLTFKNLNAPKGFPTKIEMDIHGCSKLLREHMSIPVTMVKDGLVVIGFARKGQRSVKALGLFDMGALLHVRAFILGLAWEGKDKEAIVTKPLLLKLHAEMAVGTDPHDDAYLRALLKQLNLND